MTYFDEWWDAMEGMPESAKEAARRAWEAGVEVGMTMSGEAQHRERLNHRLQNQHTNVEYVSEFCASNVGHQRVWTPPKIVA